MTYILDTHILLWWFTDPSKLSPKAQMIIEDRNKLVFVSSVSTWEIIIKKSLGKLEVPSKIFSLIEKESFQELPVTISHTKELEKLPRHHNDPFDRLLIAQAIKEKAIKDQEAGLVKVDFVEVPDYVKFLKKKIEKKHKKPEKKPTPTPSGPGTPAPMPGTTPEKPQDKSSEEPTQTPQEKKEEKEKAQAVAQQHEKQAEQTAKAQKHTQKAKQPQIQRKALKK